MNVPCYRVGLAALLAISACASGPVAPVKDAGVNRVFATVRGVTWTPCAATMEIALRQRLAGVAAVTISESAQTTEVIFAPGDYPFSVDVFKAALKQADVEVVTLDVDACGTVEQQGDRRWLQAGATQLTLAAGSGPGPGGTCVAGRLQEEAGQVRLMVTRVERPDALRGS